MAKTSLSSCPYCGKKTYTPQHLDARGIFITYACEPCWKIQKKSYRPDVLTDPNYWHDEPIDDYE